MKKVEDELKLMKATGKELSLEALIGVISKNPIINSKYDYSIFTTKQREEIKKDLVEIFEKLIDVMIKNSKFLPERINAEKPDLRKVLSTNLSESDIDFIFRLLDKI